MKILGKIEDVLALGGGLPKFVLTACPWIHDNWDPERIGWIFILDDGDLEPARALCVVPNSEDEQYRQSMTIDLDEFDLWEGDAIHDPETGYWSVVAVTGQEYGFCLFLADALVQQLPNLKRRIAI